MKNGKKPTYNQRKLLERWRMDTRVWLVVKDTPKEMVVVHRHSDKTTRTIPKEI
jgi:hypothetical protein